MSDEKSYGLILRAVFIGAEARQKQDGFNVLCSVGCDSYRVKVTTIPRPFQLGDDVQIRIKVNSFEGRTYYSGEIL